MAASTTAVMGNNGLHHGSGLDHVGQQRLYATTLTILSHSGAAGSVAAAVTEMLLIYSGTGYSDGNGCY